MTPLFAFAILAAMPSTTARTITYHDSDIVTINTQIRYTTVIELPKGEEIVEVTCGDKQFMPVNWSANIAYLKPAKESESTNVNLLTTSGTVYSFLIREVSQDSGAHADLKVFVNPSDNGSIIKAQDHPKYVRAEEVSALQAQVTHLSAELGDASAKAKQAVDSAANDAVKKIKHDFEWDHNSKASKEFGVTAIYHDDKFTYIECDTQTAPTLYAVKDGKDELVQYELRDGRYVVARVLDEGYLRVGKSKLTFKRVQG